MTNLNVFQSIVATSLFIWRTIFSFSVLATEKYKQFKVYQDSKTDFEFSNEW